MIHTDNIQNMINIINMNPNIGNHGSWCVIIIIYIFLTAFAFKYYYRARITLFEYFYYDAITTPKFEDLFFAS